MNGLPTEAFVLALAAVQKEFAGEQILAYAYFTGSSVDLATEALDLAEFHLGAADCLVALLPSIGVISESAKFAENETISE